MNLCEFKVILVGLQSRLHGETLSQQQKVTITCGDLGKNMARNKGNLTRQSKEGKKRGRKRRGKTCRKYSTAQTGHLTAGLKPGQ